MNEFEKMLRKKLFFYVVKRQQFNIDVSLLKQIRKNRTNESMNNKRVRKNVEKKTSRHVDERQQFDIDISILK